VLRNSFLYKRSKLSLVAVTAAAAAAAVAVHAYACIDVDLRVRKSSQNSGAMPVALEYPQKGFLELLVGERVAERVDGTVEVAQPVGDVIEKGQAAAVGERTEPDDEGEDVPRGPAEDERSEDDRDGSQRLPGSVLNFQTETETEITISRPKPNSQDRDRDQYRNFRLKTNEDQDFGTRICAWIKVSVLRPRPKFCP